MIFEQLKINEILQEFRELFVISKVSQNLLFYSRYFKDGTITIKIRWITPTTTSDDDLSILQTAVYTELKDSDPIYS